MPRAYEDLGLLLLLPNSSELFFVAETKHYNWQQNIFIVSRYWFCERHLSMTICFHRSESGVYDLANYCVFALSSCLSFLWYFSTSILRLFCIILLDTSANATRSQNATQKFALYVCVRFTSSVNPKCACSQFTRTLRFASQMLKVSVQK